MTSGLLMSFSLSSMFVERLLFSVVSVHGDRLIGGIIVCENWWSELKSSFDIDIVADNGFWL